MEETELWPAGVEEIEHTADWAMRVSAPSAVELFRRSALGLYHMVGMRVAARPGRGRHVRLAAVDWESLLVAWLNELLYLHDRKREAYPDISIASIDSEHVDAHVHGGRVTAWSRDIKAVTFHNLHVISGPELWQATVVFDV